MAEALLSDAVRRDPELQAKSVEVRSAATWMNTLLVPINSPR